MLGVKYTANSEWLMERWMTWSSSKVFLKGKIEAETWKRKKKKHHCGLKPNQIEIFWIKSVLSHFLHYLQQILFSGMSTNLGPGRHREITLDFLIMMLGNWIIKSNILCVLINMCKIYFYSFRCIVLWVIEIQVIWN